MSGLRDHIERARLAQQKFDKSQDVQLEISPGQFAPHEWGTEDEAKQQRENELNQEWERWISNES